MLRNAIDVKIIMIKKKGVHSVNGCFVSGIRLETCGPYQILDLCDLCISELYTFLGLNKEEDD